MLSKKQKDAVISRLRSLFEAVSDEASRNPDFFARIEGILLSPEAIVATQQSPSSAAKTPALNLLELLHRKGSAATIKALEELTNDELAKLATADGVKKLKEAKSMERPTLIDLLIETAANRLRQGESFTKG